MRTTIGIAVSLLLGYVLGADAIAATTPTSLEERLDELNYLVGDEAQLIVDFQINERVYLDDRHVIVPDASSQAYLLTLTDPCHDLRSKRVMALTRTRHQMAPGDTLAPTHEGRRVDECEVERIHELNVK
jgi:hypothetical protein